MNALGALLELSIALFTKQVHAPVNASQSS
jgi:hypothetical protein